jgi:hypothetical protein
MCHFNIPQPWSPQQHGITKLYGGSLSFGSLNLNLNCSVMILTPKPPSNNTSSIVFFPIYTWIITI